MRVPTISIYNQATYQLNRITSDLSDANEEVSTGLKINCASDDASGMTQVLSIDSALTALDQYQENVDQAQTVLTTAEDTLDAVADQLSELKLLCSSLANASSSTQERTDAAESMLVYLDTLLDLANTESYGGYIFGGDDNQTTPFTCDNADNPTCITYNGSDDAVNISISENTTLSLGCCGSDMFYEDEIIVDSTNNQIVFTEDAGLGEDDILTIEATITSGTYSKEELAAVVQDTLNTASQEQGYGIVYEVEYDDASNTFSIDTDGGNTSTTVTFEAIETETVRVSSFESTNQEFDDVEIEIINESALTEFTEEDGSEPLTLTYTEDGTWAVSNDPGYGLPSEIEASDDTIKIDVDDDGTTDIVIDLNETPEVGASISFDIEQGFENASILTDLGFDSETVTLSPVSSDYEVGSVFTVTAGGNDTIDFIETTEDGEVSVQLTATIEAGTYSDPESYAKAVEDALESASAENGNRVNYSVEYNEDSDTFTISEDVDTGRQLESFELLFSSGTHTASSAASDLGFNTKDVSSGPVEGQEASWSVWDTILDLKDALESDDVDGIQRAMTRLENHYESITSSISSIGTTYNVTTSVEATISNSDSTLTSRLSTVQDADYVESVMVLNSTQTVYEAALSSTSSVMGLSLVDYLS